MTRLAVLSDVHGNLMALDAVLADIKAQGAPDATWVLGDAIRSLTKKLLPDGGTVGIGRGSDTALNALQRTDGFLDAIKGSGIKALEPVNDKEDAARALELANSVLLVNPDLAGAFGVYAYNGPAWATAIREAGRIDTTRLVLLWKQMLVGLELPLLLFM